MAIAPASMLTLRSDISREELRKGVNPVVGHKDCQKYLVKTAGGVMGIYSSHCLGPALANAGFPDLKVEVFEHDFQQVWELGYNTDQDYVLVGLFQSEVALLNEAKQIHLKQIGRVWWKRFEMDNSDEHFHWFV